MHPYSLHNVHMKPYLECFMYKGVAYNHHNSHSFTRLLVASLSTSAAQHTTHASGASLPHDGQPCTLPLPYRPMLVAPYRVL
jgi:hypothetical protein